MNTKISNTIKELEIEIEKYKALQQTTRLGQASEKTRLIQKSIEDVVTVGEALSSIKTDKLWKDLDYTSFKEYVHLELGFTITWANQMMSYAKAAQHCESALHAYADWDYDLSEFLTQRCLQIWAKAARKEGRCKQLVKELNNIANRTGLMPFFAELQIAYKRVLAKEKAKEARIKNEIGEPDSKVKPTSPDSDAEAAELYKALKAVKLQLETVEQRWKPITKMVRQHLGTDNMSEDDIVQFLKNHLECVFA